jgi:hypothetical protein
MPNRRARVDRRQFLEIGGAATAALLASCKGNTRPPSFSSDGPAPSIDGAAPLATDGPGALPRDAAPVGADAAKDAGTDAAADGPPAPLTEADWQALASSLSGSLIRPGNPLYNQARVVFNTRFDTVMP